MENVISVENMRLSDFAVINSGVPSLTLMKNAAKGILSATEWNGKISIVVGSGNNGGDGFALACELSILKDQCPKLSIQLEILSISDKYSPDSEFYMHEALKHNVPIHKINSPLSGLFTDSNIIVDCIFGTGFHGEVNGIAAEVIREINKSSAYVVSADINSGINGDTGITNLAIKSDITVSIGQLKNGFFINDAPKYMGSIVNANIGIPAQKKENYILNEFEFKSKYDDMKNAKNIKRYNSFPSNIKTINELKKISASESCPLLIETAYTSFLATESAVWILAPENVLEPITIE